jgi:hypothetical protein
MTAGLARSVLAAPRSTLKSTAHMDRRNLATQKIAAIAAAVISLATASLAAAPARADDGVANLRTIFDSGTFVVQRFDIIRQGFPTPACTLTQPQHYKLNRLMGGLIIMLPNPGVTGSVTIEAAGRSVRGQAQPAGDGSMVMVADTEPQWGPFNGMLLPGTTLVITGSDSTLSVPLASTKVNAAEAVQPFVTWKQCTNTKAFDYRR